MPSANRHDKDKRQARDATSSRVGNWNRNGRGGAHSRRRSFIEDMEMDFQRSASFSMTLHCILRHPGCRCIISLWLSEKSPECSGNPFTPSEDSTTRSITYVSKLKLYTVSVRIHTWEPHPCSCVFLSFVSRH